MGRGSSKASSNKFSSVSELENSLKGNNDPRIKQYSDGLTEERSYNSGLEKNLRRSIDEDGYTSTTESIINSEINDAKKQLNNMPKSKTPKQLGQEQALQERLDILNGLKKRKGAKGKGKGDIDIVV